MAQMSPAPEPMIRVYSIAPEKHNGVTLLEVLIALFVLSVGLLGMAGLQLTSLKNSYSAQLRTEATLQANNILERMRLNRQVAKTGGYDIPLSASPPSGLALVDQDLSDWLNTLASNLPSGDGSVSTNAVTGVTVITVQWDDSKGTSGSSTQSFTMGSML